MSTITSSPKRTKIRKNKMKMTLLDYILLAVLVVLALLIVIPFWNVIMISFSTPKEYADNPLMMLPANPTLENYKALFADGSILTGYWNTFKLLIIGLPLSLFLTITMAYALSRNKFPGKKLIFMLVLFTMIFNGGIVPLYLIMKALHLTGTLWSVILAGSFSAFNMILMMNYFQGLPESLMESARLDGAGEWKILFSVVLPLAAPIIATITLFYGVAIWNSWYDAMIFLRKADQLPLQNVLRTIIVESQTNASNASSVDAAGKSNFSTGMKMAAVFVSMVPIMCFFPMLQKHFAKGVLTGAIKT
ncbi:MULTISPECIES: carbohydrate ABC transporter permease [Paenibacillus]|jgi:putative aldouronate transport system permease protein|uniref:Binding-protein-dependent transport systems inner membrane component n=2 Tax=Paenibacillus lactis TaxID=228574 RepID=G4HCE1_9BACL|nr:carbohydrate ABC transporter permease [Paenibacillus lactis]EHB65717.1 binding-protein-dependent transport systems inner membrane component [Paenibacillus lactis 154]MBP1891101.1 putative aldouronate transport system permease protein [Paenibacillus lactis]MCM3493555.1 carbohydrate ABC transporter permease [Paenibacillus lactis]GIO92664.1 putative ABC transporter permease protein YtcP [Paenibacillus lactis]HAG00475.1 carbohydrate ABC transporter permease [Paenibacillus lactis]